MDLIADIPIIGNLVITLVAFIFLIGVVIFVHEYGHYIVGRWRGIHAETFSLGFGPVIYARTDKRGTRWQLAAIPLGGYVKFLGDRNAASAADNDAVSAMNAYDRQRSFPAASLISRSLTVLAGPVANFILSIVVFAGLAFWQGFAIDHPTFGKISQLPVSLEVREGDKIIRLNDQLIEDYGDLFAVIDAMEAPANMRIQVERDTVLLNFTIPYLRIPVVQSVVPLSPALSAGIEEGDVILQANDEDLRSFADLVIVVLASGESEIQLTIWRDGDVIQLPLTPEIVDVLNNDGTVSQIPRIGIGGGLYFEPASETPMIWDAAWVGVTRTYDTIAQTFNVLGLMFSGQLSPKNLQGPVGIAQVSGVVVQQSIFSFIGLIAIISTSIGILNLLPIPILDGGHLMTYLYEAVRGRPPSPAFLNVFMSIGLALVMILMVFTLYNDILRL